MTTSTRTTAKKTAAPQAPATDQEKLLEPFPPEWIGKLPRITCRACSQSQRRRCDDHTWIRCDECKGSHSSAAMHLDYVGHADVTRRLLEVDPAWTWEPLVLDPETGLPKRDEYGGMWMRLTVHIDGEPVTRLGYGDSQGKTGPNAIKEVIGDGLRNAAMRFGVALDLWAKGDRSAPPEPHSSSDGAPAGDEVSQKRQTRTAKKTAAPQADDAPAADKPDPQQEARAQAAQASATNASKADDLAALKTVWDGAKEAGLLQTEIAHPTTGEAMPLTSYITERKTEMERKAS